MIVRDPEQALPRSALRYRPLTNQTWPSPIASRAHRSRPDGRETAAPVSPDDLEPEEHTAGRSRRAPAARIRRRVPPLVLIGIGLVATILLCIGASLTVNWGQHAWNTLQYGNPRTFQIDAVVGNGDSAQHPSHFLAVNLHGVVTIIEFPAGDASHARVLISTTVFGPDADQAVAILRFIDVNHNGEPDLLMIIDGTESVLVNDRGTFRLPTPAEERHLLQIL